MELLNQFQSIDVELHEACAVDQLQIVTKQFQEIMNSITDDPRALSLLGKKRGQKGFREIQGDSLRTSLDSVYRSLVSEWSIEQLLIIIMLIGEYCEGNS